MRQVLMLVSAVLVAGGCSAPPEAGEMPAVVPVDFSLDIAVIGDEGETLPADRFVLFPDGTLHCGISAGRGARWLPEPVRHLSRRQMAEIWSECGRLGLLDPDTADRVVNPNLIEQVTGPRVSTWFTAVTGADHRWNFVRGTADATAQRELVDKLAVLAWAEELRRRDIITPRRYDFGPDPYAQFRYDTSNDQQ
jgi:hypothetical protein